MSLTRFAMTCLAVLVFSLLPTQRARAGDAVEIPWIKGAFRHVLDPPGMKSDPQKRQWYVNDHCFFVEDDGTIHWFGITNPYPEGKSYYGPGTHQHIGHATARHPFGPWQEHPDAVTAPGPEVNVGACCVVKAQDGYVMLYGYNTGFKVATSPDLYSWRPQKDPDRINLGRGTRDPCVLARPGGGYLLYAAAGHGPVGAVALAQSADLRRWEKREPALVSDVPGNWGPLESPFVHERNGLFYLFLNHSHHQYQETLVFVSADPQKFQWTDPLCTVFAHAAEIFEWGGKTYISHCGIEDRHWDRPGLYVAELSWSDPATESDTVPSSFSAKQDEQRGG